MTVEIRQLPAGLYFVATPLGAARDITLRALDVLASADVLAAEDTRTLRHLMQLHGIAVGDRPMIAYHDHNGAEVRPRLIRIMQEGKSVAYASEAGTPLVADPGYPLARETVSEGIKVVPVPGPSAVTAALTVAGLPTDRFLFAGFPPAAAGARKSWMAEIARVPATLVIYESPKRINRTLYELCEVAGGERQAAVCRELTKRFEETLRGTLADLAAATAERPPKGEIVLVVDRGREEATEQDMETALRAALEDMSVKDAAAAVAGALGLPKRDVYQAALRLDRGDD
ncbi:16S rRNA (cytidine(1402)-2'-O)-methyltransferase [Psychromarinibacter halotolerans]|uniref:Ribosomal RNA small subunit methyltransferase I n=1 Tax=Psychromarinibacter halotolerans TaxID=1775175 RepID=A0ABV7GKD2_9RHOB|nr:16S rRNA (cytidine(1402)-2'-O)-methyltransferase [Psychromarinibacter halotolerans]MDF0595505.1 16S rRNA (cytidine(1402)-2'-O)-methyltransferase [Psychromarinibacter halotolerans]